MLWGCARLDGAQGVNRERVPGVRRETQFQWPEKKMAARPEETEGSPGVLMQRVN